MRMRCRKERRYMYQNADGLKLQIAAGTLAALAAEFLFSLKESRCGA